ncbi:MAG: thiolase family protein [Oscillibacter sp.]
MKEAVIVAFGRSAIGKAPKGILKDTRPDDYAPQVLRGVLAKLPQLDPAIIDDIVLGCAFPEAEQGVNTARLVALHAGVPECVSAYTINRFCASGLQSIANAANSIMAGQNEVVVAGGMESMSAIPMGGNFILANSYLMENNPDSLLPMGNTAENVAAKYGITREEQDAFGYNSHLKAAKAQAEGKFDAEIIPVDAVKVTHDAQGNPVRTTVTFQKDEGVRPNITKEALAKLPTVFQKNGTVTPGNASQMSDGASFVVLMEKEKAAALGIPAIARFVSFASAGVDPALMGLGPIAAIPKALKLAGLTTDDIDLFELNEAFASQAIACVRELGLDEEKVNVNGGAIALGHPLACTGSFLTCKLLPELARRKARYGVVSMCVGGGMGSAAVMELL